MKVFQLLFSLFFISTLFSQQPAAIWTNRYNGAGDYSDKFNCVKTDASGNIYMAGYTVRTGDRLDYLTVKLNAAGDTLWTATFNGTDSKDDEILAMAIDASGNSYVTGYSKDLQFNDDIVTIKYDPNGNQLWSSTYNNVSSGQDDQANDICIDQSGNIVVVGQTDIDPTANTDDAFIVLSYTSNGTLNWSYLHDVGITDRAAKVVANASGIYVTGRTDNGNDDDVTVLKFNVTGSLLWNNPVDIAGLNDRPSDMALDASGNVIVCGRTDNGNDDDALVVKLNATGTFLWGNFYAGSAAGNDRSYAIAIDPSGNIYTAGKTDSDPNAAVTDYDYLMVKYNASGAQQWAQTYGGAANLVDEANALCITTTGNIVVTGRSDASINPAVSDYGIKTIAYNSAGVQQWTQYYQSAGNQNENGNAITAYASGSVILAGTEQNAQGQSNALALNFSSTGATSWQKNYNGMGDNSDNVNAIVVDASGNSYLAGYTYSMNGLKDMCVIKLSPAGDTLWVRTHDGTDGGNDEANDIKVDNSGNVYVTGYTKESTTDYDITTLKFTSAGVMSWAVSFDNATVNGEDKGSKLLLDPTGNIYVTGYVDRDASANLNEDVVLLKYNATGVLQWSKQYNGTGNGKDVPASMSYLNSSKIVLTGNSFNGTDQDGLTLEFSSSGTQLWAKTYDGGNGDDKFTSISIDPTENIYVSGRSFNGADYDLLSVQYTVSGTQSWFYAFNSGNGDDEFTASVFSSTGSLYVAGSASNGNNSDVILVRLNPSGSELWHKLFDGQSQLNDVSTALYFDLNNYIVLAGETEVSGIPSTQNDFLLNKFNESGDLIWSVTYDSGELMSDGINAMTCDATGNIYVTGNSTVLNGQKDIVTIKYDSPLGLKDLKNDFSVNGMVYPNPTTGQIFLDLPQSAQDWQISISDNSGKCMKTDILSGTEKMLDLNGLPAGLYLLSAQQDHQTYHLRVVKK